MISGFGLASARISGLGAHLGHHVLLEHAGGRQAEEDVRAFDHLGQRALVGVLRIDRLVLVHQLGAALVDHARQVGDPDVLARHAQLDQQSQAGQRGSAGARGHQLDLPDVLADDLQAVEHRGAHHDGGAVLVVVEDRECFMRSRRRALDVEAVGRLDVLEVDAAEGRLERGDAVDQLVEVVLLVDLDVEHVDAGELLEEHSLALHHRLGRQRPDVAQAQHGRAVGDHGHQVAARGVAEGVDRVGDDLLAGGRHAGRIRQREVALVGQLLGGADGHFAGRRELVVFECGLAQLGAFFFSSGHRDPSWCEPSPGRRRRGRGDAIVGAPGHAQNCVSSFACQFAIVEGAPSTPRAGRSRHNPMMPLDLPFSARAAPRRCGAPCPGSRWWG